MRRATKIKTYKNSLIIEKLTKLDNKEKQEIILELLKTRTERELEEEIGVSHNTIHGWKTIRPDYTGANIHVSLSAMYRKLSDLNPKTKQIKTKNLAKPLKKPIKKI